MTGYTAVEHVRELSSTRRERDLERVDELVARHRPWSLREMPATADLASWMFRFPITINFHPDRIAGDGLTAAQSLAATAIYRSQFETGVSAGSVTADGGDRQRWEALTFDLRDRVDPAHRPRYGGLNVAGHPDGACPRFGSCVLVLRPEVLARCTFSVGDSSQGPTDVGTVDQPIGLLAGLLETAMTTQQALRLPDGDAPGIVRRLSAPGEPALPRGNGRALDEYLEAHVHGPVHLDSDVAQLVLDPSFSDTETGSLLSRAAARHGIPVRRHRGFVLNAGDVGPDFRGPEIPLLARRLENEFGGPLTAEVIGRAAHALTAEPAGGAGRPDLAAQLPQLKLLWHTLVEYGRPAGPLSAPRASR